MHCVLWAYFSIFDIMSMMCLESQKILKGPDGDGKERLVHYNEISIWKLS